MFSKSDRCTDRQKVIGYLSAEVMSSFQFGDLPADFESDLIINIDPSTEKTQTLSAQSLLQLLNDTEMLSYTEANISF